MRLFYKVALFLIVSVLFCSSCINTQKECIQDYLEADDWMVERTMLSGDNKEAIKRVYEKYLEKYAEIDSRCNSKNKRILPRL